MHFRTPHLVGSERPLTARPVQRWALVAGWASLLLPLPSVAWRVVMLAGVDVGLGIADFYRSSTAAIGYVLGLDVAQVAAGVLCFGLVRPWSEVVPRWVPGLGGRGIPRAVPGTLGAVGVVALCYLVGTAFFSLLGTWLGITDGWTPDEGMSAGERALLLACYVPFFLWPIATAVTVAGYWLRRRPEDSRAAASRTAGATATPQPAASPAARN